MPLSETDTQELLGKAQVGDRAAVDELFARNRERLKRMDRELAELLDQVSRKLQAGEPVDSDALAREHPEYAERLKSIMPALHMMADLGYSLELRASVGVRPSVEAYAQTTNRPTALGVLGDYRILREIGRGGMAVVYEADQISLGRRVALKVLPFAAVLDSRQLQRFKNEAHAAAQLHHQNIVPVYSVGSERGVHYYAMHYIEGQTLAEVIKELRVESRELSARGDSQNQSAKQSPDAARSDAAASSVQQFNRSTVQRSEALAALTTERSANSREFFRTIARLGVQAAEALEHAHTLGVVHRDIKPGNLMLDTRGSLWITDFGLAHFNAGTGHSLTMTGDLVGTLRYMSPEQALAKRVIIDHRTDVYSLGVTLYEFMTLEPAFDGRDRQEVLRKIAFDDPRPPRLINKAVPAELETILLKTMEKKPEERYATARELVDDLCRFLEDRPIRAKRPTLVQKTRKWARRHQAVVWSAAVSAAALLMMAVVALAVSNVLINRQKQHVISEKEKAERAELESKHRLFDARLAQARASRWSRKVGQRFESWRAVTEAAELARELGLGEERLAELRDEAIACLALADLRPAREPWEGWPPGSSAGLAFDADLKRYARSDLKWNISVRLVADDQEEALLPSDELGEAALGGAAHMLFSPDGKFLAVRYWEHLPGQATNFRLWDWQQGTVVFQLPFPVHGSAMGFSPDGRLLALGQSDGTLTIHDAATGAEEKRMSLGLEPFHLALAPDGSKLAVSSFAGQVQVRDVTTGNLLRPLAIPGRPSQVAWHQAGVLLATACSDSHVYLWDSATGEQRAVLRGHQAPVESVAFTPGSDTLLTTAYDGTSRLWDVWTGRELMRFPGRAYGFSRDGRRLASQAGYNLNLWEVAPGREYRTLPGSQASNTEHIRGGGISPDGRWLVVAQGGSYRLWDLHSGTVTNIYSESHAEDAQFHPSGREFFTSGRAGLYRWPVHAEAGVLRIGPARRLPVTGGTGAVALDRAGQTLAATGDHGGWVLDLEKPTGNVAHVEHVNAQSVAISPDGQWVATGTQHGFGVKIWDARIGRLALAEPLIPDERDAAVDFSPDGRWLVIGTGAEFSIWETGSWQLARTFRREQAGGRPGKAAFTPDGKILATEVSTGLVVLLDPASGRRLARLEAPESSPISWLTFTPDGSQLVVCADAGQIAVWNLRRIRQHLTEIGLDWDLQPYSPANEHQRFDPLEVIVDLGNLAQADDSRMHCNRAREHVRAKEWEKAIAEYAEAASLDPDNARAQNNFAWLLVTCPEAEFRDVIRAMKHAEKAVELAPYDDATWNTLGVVRYRAREWAGVIEALKKSEELAPGKYFSFNAFFVALAHWQLGSTGVTDHGSRASDQTLTAEEQAQHKEEARRWYRKAVEWMEKNEPNDEELRRFREEAVELLETKEGKD